MRIFILTTNPETEIETTKYFADYTQLLIYMDNNNWVAQSPMDIRDGTKAAYARESLGMFGAPTMQTASIGWLTTVDDGPVQADKWADSRRLFED